MNRPSLLPLSDRSQPLYARGEGASPPQNIFVFRGVQPGGIYAHVLHREPTPGGPRAGLAPGPQAPPIPSAPPVHRAHRAKPKKIILLIECLTKKYLQ
jgi:hypothetical protein